LKLEIMMAY